MTRIIPSILIFGALGGICPTLVKLASYYSTTAGAEMPEASAYIGLGLFAFIGAIVAIGFDAPDLRSALVAGISAPALITNILAGANGDGSAVRANPQQQTSLFIAAAYAQEAPNVVAEIGNGGRLLTLNTNTAEEAEGNVSINYIFINEDGAFLPVGGSLPANAQSVDILIPNGAAQISINGFTYDLTETEDQLQVIIEANPTFGGDLLWALGAQRQFVVDDVQFAPVSESVSAQ